MRKPLTTVFLVCALLAGAASASEGPGFLILTPEDLKEPAETLARQRRREGLSVEVHDLRGLIGDGNALKPETIRKHVREVHKRSGKRLAYLLLMGDAPGKKDPAGRTRIPPKILERGYFPRSITGKAKKTVVSDTWYGMLDGDALPDLAVGRLPADTAEEADAMVRRILDFGSKMDFGPWRNRLHVVAGNYGGGPMEELFIGYSLNWAYGKKLSPAYDTTHTYAIPSPYCYPPPSFPGKVISLFNEGCRLWIYEGHGSTQAFGWHEWKGKRDFVFSSASVPRIAIRRGAPMMFLLTCCSGEFSDPITDCIAESLMKTKAGPVAVFASSRVCDYYASGILSLSIPDHFRRASHGTIGRALLAVQRALVVTDSFGLEEVDRISALFLGTKKQLRHYRIDHIHMYNLLGDPTMPLGAPKGRMTIRAQASAFFGAGVTLECELDRAYTGELRLVVESKPGTPLQPLEPVKGLSGKALLDALKVNWERSNHRILAKAVTRIDGSHAPVHIDLPEGKYPAGEYIIRVFVHDAKGCAVGWKLLRIDKRKAEDEGEF